MTRALCALALILLALRPALAADGGKPPVTLYKSPECGCCEAYADTLRDHGFAVTVIAEEDLWSLKRRHGVPEGFDGCHTSIIEGYVVEGHVPVAVLETLLAERPDIRGISLPGMPQGSPGMSGTKQGPFTIYGFDDGETHVYAVE